MAVHTMVLDMTLRMRTTRECSEATWRVKRAWADIWGRNPYRTLPKQMLGSSFADLACRPLVAGSPCRARQPGARWTGRDLFAGIRRPHPNPRVSNGSRTQAATQGSVATASTNMKTDEF